MMRRAVLLLLAAVAALAARPAHAAVWEITGWDRPAQANNQLQTFPKARCGDTIKIACAPGVKAGIFKMNDQSGYCVKEWDKTTGVELSPVKIDCTAEFTIGENDKTFFLTSHGEGDCAAGLKMNVKIPPCNPNIGYAVAPSKLLAAAGNGGKNATNGTFAVVPAAKTFNASAAAAKVVDKASSTGAAALAASSSGGAAAGSLAAVAAVAALAGLIVVV